MSLEAAFGRPRHMPAWRSPGLRWTVPVTPAQRGAPTDLHEAVEEFLTSRRAMNCTPRTVALYADLLNRFQRATTLQTLEQVTPLVVRGYLARLLERMKPTTAHGHYRCLKTFLGWTVEAGLMAESPMRGFKMQTPKTLPRVPEDTEVRRLLAACRDTFEGQRNRALVGLLVDSALRSSEALHLRVEDVDFAARRLRIRAGKGQKDGVGHFGMATAALLRPWLALRPEAGPDDPLFCDRAGRSLTRSHATHILHRLSEKAGLPRKIGPHALRHYAATSLLRQTGDLELVRRVLRHESLAMTLKYAHLTGVEIAAKFQRASPLDTLRAGR